jgi:hypothetical protein
MANQHQSQVETAEHDHGEPGGDVAWEEAPENDGGRTRSAQNIAQWISYLPPDCVKTMIDMGWDRTT